MAAPWFKIYAAELLSKPETALLEDDQLGKLVRLWAYASMSECSIPSDPESIAKLLRIPNAKQMDKHLVWIRQFFRPSDDPGRLTSNRLARESEAYENKCAKLKANGLLGGRPLKTQCKPDGKPNGLANGLPDGSGLLNHLKTEVEVEKENTSTPLSPRQGATATDAKPRKPRKPRFQAEDITPENSEFLRKVYERIPTEHPVTGEPVHKGPFAEAARNFQAIADSGEATPRELMAVGTVYYRAEILGETWVESVNRVWDSRPRAMMQVSTLYGPQKRAYRQLLPLARKLIEYRDAEAAKQVENVVPLEAAS